MASFAVLLCFDAVHFAGPQVHTVLDFRSLNNGWQTAEWLSTYHFGFSMRENNVEDHIHFRLSMLDPPP